MSPHRILSPVLPIVLLVLHYSVLAQGCPRGSFQSSSGCQPCRPGTYSTTPNSPSCKPCPAGTFFSFKGAQTEVACQICPPGTFSTLGSSSCTSCPHGTSSTQRATKCISCPPGTSIASNDRCEPCFSGTYQDLPNQLECKNCPDADVTFTLPKATSIDQCKRCPPGTERGAFGACTPCPPGTFRETSESDVCKPCPLGSVADKKEGATSCTPCPIGSYGVDIGFRRSIPACEPCAKGSTTYAEGRTFCRVLTSTCPARYYETFAGDCIKCRKDEYFSYEDRKCISCPKGTGNMEGLEPKCRPCVKILNEGSKTPACVANFPVSIPMKTDENGNCPPGSFKNMKADGACDGCKPGFFSDKINAEKCTKCPSGSVQEKAKQSSCTPCPAGTIDFQNSFCINPQSGCPPGAVLVKNENGVDVCRKTG